MPFEPVGKSKIIDEKEKYWKCCLISQNQS